MSRKHDGATEQQIGSSTDSVEQQNTGERHDDVDSGQDDGEDVRVVDTGVSSEDRTVVEEEVDTRDLLADLDEDTDHGSVENHVLHTETLEVGSIATLVILFLSESDVLHFDRDGLIIDGQVSHSCQVVFRLLPSVFASEEPRRFGAQGESDQEQSGPNKLDTDGESPGPVSATLRCAVGHAVDQEDTEGDTKLERSSDQTSHGRRCGLSLENRNETRGATDTETGDGTTDTDLGVGGEG